MPGPRDAQRPTPASSQRTMLLPNALPLSAALPRPCAGVCKAGPGRAEGVQMKRMLINATQPEERRLAIVDGQKLMDFVSM